MTSLNLTQRIWLSFVLLVFLVGIVIAVVYPLSIQDALKNQSYKMIEQQQRVILSDVDQFTPNSKIGFIKSREAARVVNHLIVTSRMSLLKGESVPSDVLQTMGNHAVHQKSNLGEYELSYQGATLFYVERKVIVNNQHAFLISYMWDTYRNQMVETLWGRLLWILLLAGLLSFVLALWLARYLRHPLILLGNRFEEIAKRNWQTSFEWKGKGEFRRLSDQFEHMRQNLIRFNHSQKMFIQHASHELKTPIMIIKSYAQSVKDGIMPKGSLEETMDVIMGESERMEERVKELIYYTKLDTLKDETPSRHEEPFGSISGAVIERLRVQREDVNFSMEGENISFYIDRNQWQVLIENLVENALRYARSQIRLRASEDDWFSVLRVYNDGGSIPEEERNHLFDPFYKGSKGQFGLGLAIVKRIVELHQGQITVLNVKDGVDFIVKIPKEF